MQLAQGISRTGPHEKVISVPETEPHCSRGGAHIPPHEHEAVISVPETEPHCSQPAHPDRLVGGLVISVPETEPHCSAVPFCVFASPVRT